MVAIKTRALTRKQISEFISSERGVRAFEEVQSDATTQGTALTDASFVVVTAEPTLGSERALVLTAGDLSGVDGGANGNFTISLADTAVAANTYGGAIKTMTLTVDAKGRITALSDTTITAAAIGAVPTARTITAGAGLSGGGDLSANRTLSLDTTSSRNVDHSAVSINAGTGLTGGGDLTATRSIGLGTSGVTAGTYSPPLSITVDAYGRIIAIS